MTNTSNFNESDHNRDANKRFADKVQGAPEVTVAAPRKLGVLGGYEIKSFKQLSTGAMTGNIFRDGKHVMTVSNDGNGGSNRYGRPIPKAVETAEQSRAANDKYRDEEKAFNDMAIKALGKSVEEGDGFVETLVWNSDIEKHAKKYNYTREQVVEDEIARHNDESSFPLSDAELELLRNPDGLTAE